MKTYNLTEEDLIVLSSFTELDYSVKRTLLDDFTSYKPLFGKHEKFLIKTLSDGVYNKVRENFQSSAYREKILNGLEKDGIECVTYFSEDYPEVLKNTGAPPVTLYCRGDVSLLNGECFAVVGSRTTLAKQLADCKKISGELTEAFTVVTGLAEGADSAAAQGALESGGKVISVLANGLNRVYPSVNRGLKERIEKEGLVISEYPPETPPKYYYFPVRNRIIAGLSRGTLVVSGGIKSGALITAGYSFEYDREVFAFPYNAGVTSGAGCNHLIKTGAHLTENILDIFNEFGLNFNTREKCELSAAEREVLNRILETGEGFLPEIAAAMGKPAHELIPVISMLEIKGLIVGIGGNRYSAVNR